MQGDGVPPVDVLGIEVERRQLETWLDWYMPAVQPYLVPRDVATRLGLEDEPDRLTMELRDEKNWSRLGHALPGARRAAGTFPGRSGPNCFGTVMAAAGVPGAAEVWMLREPFEDWLAAATRRGGTDDVPGTVLVWRSPDGMVQHAAITIGDGFAVHKPSQGWQSPTKVLTTTDAKLSSRARGRRLSRHALV